MTVCSLYGDTLFWESGIGQKTQAAVEDVLRGGDSVLFIIHWEYDFGLQCLDAIARAHENYPGQLAGIAWVNTAGPPLQGEIFQWEIMPPTVKWYQSEAAQRRAARKWMVATSDVVISYCYDKFFDEGAGIGLAVDEGAREHPCLRVDLTDAGTYRCLKAQLYRLTPLQREVNARRRAGWSPWQTARQMGLPLWRELLLEAGGIWNLYLAEEAESRALFWKKPYAPLFSRNCTYYGKKKRYWAL